MPTGKLSLPMRRSVPPWASSVAAAPDFQRVISPVSADMQRTSSVAKFSVFVSAMSSVLTRRMAVSGGMSQRIIRRSVRTATREASEAVLPLPMPSERTR